MAIRRIGQILVDLGFIDDDQLEMLLQEQQRHVGELIGKIAVEMGLVTDEQLAQGLAGAIPFMGAVLMVSVGPDEFTAGEYSAFRVLVTMLILAGMLGARLANTIGRRISVVIETFAGDAGQKVSPATNR